MQSFTFRPGQYIPTAAPGVIGGFMKMLDELEGGGDIGDLPATVRLKGEPSNEQLRQGREFAAWLKLAIDRAGLNANVLSQKIGKSPAYLYMLLNGGIHNGSFKRPSERVIRSIADATGADVAAGLRAAWPGLAYVDAPRIPSALSDLPPDAQAALLRLVNVLQPSDTVLLPVLGRATASVAGGAFVESRNDTLYTAASMLDAPRERIPVPRHMVAKYPEGECFAVRVAGDCLGGLAIIAGDLLICRQADTAENGAVVVVIEGEEAVAKRLRRKGQKAWLETVPTSGDSEVIEVSSDARIIGVMVGLYRAI